MQSVEPKGQNKTDSHWVDSTVNSQSEAAVSVKFTKKEAANHSRVAETSLVTENEQLTSIQNDMSQ